MRNEGDGMKRLIDANAFKKENERLLHCDFPYLSETTLEELIDEAPTIDAEPVRHAKWIKADSQQYFRKHYPCFTCSECGYRKDSQKKWNYCPNCGADMRGEEEWTK